MESFEVELSGAWNRIELDRLRARKLEIAQVGLLAGIMQDLLPSFIRTTQHIKSCIQATEKFTQLLSATNERA